MEETMTTIDLLLPAKNILVYDVAASESGALSVLNDFYASVRKHGDKSILWVFVIGTPVLEETENIKIILIGIDNNTDIPTPNTPAITPSIIVSDLNTLEISF